MTGRKKGTQTGGHTQEDSGRDDGLSTTQEGRQTSIRERSGKGERGSNDQETTDTSDMRHPEEGNEDRRNNGGISGASQGTRHNAGASTS